MERGLSAAERSAAKPRPASATSNTRDSIAATRTCVASGRPGTPTMIDELKQDLVYTLRTLASARGFALVALLTLASRHRRQHGDLQRGARRASSPAALPGGRPRDSRLARQPGGERPPSQVSEPDFLDWKAASDARSRRWAPTGTRPAAAARTSPASAGPSAPGRLRHARLLRDAGRAAAVAGRIRAEEAVAGNDRFMVLSHGLWQRRFGGDPAHRRPARSRSTASRSRCSA